MKIDFVLNRKNLSIEIEPRESLAEVLRGRCRFTGVKVSCEAQVCGSCTVLVDGLPVSACTFLAYEARGKQVTTIEGLADDVGPAAPAATGISRQLFISMRILHARNDPGG